MDYHFWVVFNNGPFFNYSSTTNIELPCVSSVCFRFISYLWLARVVYIQDADCSLQVRESISISVQLINYKISLRINAYSRWTATRSSTMRPSCCSSVCCPFHLLWLSASIYSIWPDRKGRPPWLEPAMMTRILWGKKSVFFTFSSFHPIYRIFVRGRWRSSSGNCILFRSNRWCLFLRQLRGLRSVSCHIDWWTSPVFTYSGNFSNHHARNSINNDLRIYFWFS